MKGIFLYTVFSLSSLSLTAQEVIHRTKLSSTTISKVRGFVLSDGFFLNYHDNTKLGVYYPLGYQSLIIGKDGAEIPLMIPDLLDKQLVNVVSSNDSLYFYYLESQKKITRISAFVLEKKTWKRKDVTQSFVIPEGFIGGRLHKDLFLASVEKETESLHVSQVHGVELVNDESYQLPKEIFSKIASSAEVIWEGTEVTPFKAEARIKIYISQSQIIVSYDEFTGSRGIIHIFRIDRTTKNVSTLEIEERTGHDFRSFVFQDKIYRIGWEKGAVVSVFNMNKELMSSFRVDKNSSYARERAYFRIGNSKRVVGDRNVWDALSNAGRIFISVHPFDDSTVILKIGTHHIMASGPPIIIINPAFMAASLLLRAITLSFNEQNSRDYYFYLQGNTDHGFSYSNASGLVQQKIDNFELEDPGNVISYTHKSYLKSDGLGCYGIYQKKHSKELMIVGF